MRYRSTAGWQLGNPIAEDLLFFAQRLDELLDPDSLSTHKPPALNAPYLCVEALAVIANIEKELIEPANLTPILEELAWSIQGDRIAKSLLDAPADQYILQNDKTPLPERKVRLEALGRTLDPFRYLDACLDGLVNVIGQNQKKTIEFLSRTLLTTLVNLGVSKRYLLDKLVTFFFSGKRKISSKEDLVEFLKNIFPYTHDFILYFPVSDLLQSVATSLQAFDIQIEERLPTELREIARRESFRRTGEQVYARVSNIRGFDRYSAFDAAVRRLDTLSDLFTLFYHGKKIEWEPRALVIQCCEDEPAHVVAGRHPMGKAFDLTPVKASSELRRLLRNFSIRGPNRERFDRVSDLHGICVTSDVPENQLVNLWTAFETLVPSHVGSSKISGVISSILPFLVSSYIRRLLEQFYSDLVRWDRWKTKRALQKVGAARGSSGLVKCLVLLCDAAHASVRDELFGKLGDFYLLRFRAFQLSEILGKRENVLEAIKIHQKKLIWQIRRIYRSRNLIVHSGMSSSYVDTLIENGHDYLDQVLFDVIKLCCGDYAARTLEQAFEIARIKGETFLKTLEGSVPLDAKNAAFVVSQITSVDDFSKNDWPSKIKV